MDFSVKQTIRQRVSVRTFDGSGLGETDRAALVRYMERVTNPFDVPVEFRLFRAGEHGLSSPVVVGADYYIAAKVPRQGNYEMGYGYSFEVLCLWARSLGIGTVLLAASLSRKAFERAMEVRAGEVMPLATPVGYPAARRSLRESLMRKGLKADSRRPFEDLFFDGSFRAGLRKEAAGAFAEALEMARWAPSAGNRQPWRGVVVGDTVHFYEAKSIKDSALGDVQKVDVGIALAHFDLTLGEEGHTGRFFQADPGLTCPDNVTYMISYERTK